MSKSQIYSVPNMCVRDTPMLTNVWGFILRPHSLSFQQLAYQSHTKFVSVVQSADSGTATAFSSVQDLPVSDDLDQSASTQYLVKKFLHATPDVDRPMYRKDIYYMGSVQQLPQYHNDIGMSNNSSSRAATVTCRHRRDYHYNDLVCLYGP